MGILFCDICDISYNTWSVKFCFAETQKIVRRNYLYWLKQTLSTDLPGRVEAYSVHCDFAGSCSWTLCGVDVVLTTSWPFRNGHFMLIRHFVSCIDVYKRGSRFLSLDLRKASRFLSKMSIRRGFFDRIESIIGWRFYLGRRTKKFINIKEFGKNCKGKFKI